MINDSVCIKLLSQASWIGNRGPGMIALRVGGGSFGWSFATYHCARHICLQGELSSKVWASIQRTVPLVGDWIETMQSSRGCKSVERVRSPSTFRYLRYSVRSTTHLFSVLFRGCVDLDRRGWWLELRISGSLAAVPGIRHAYLGGKSLKRHRRSTTNRLCPITCHIDDSPSRNSEPRIPYTSYASTW